MEAAGPLLDAGGGDPFWFALRHLLSGSLHKVAASGAPAPLQGLLHGGPDAEGDWPDQPLRVTGAEEQPEFLMGSIVTVASE